MSRALLVAGNWKMNLTLEQARELAAAVAQAPRQAGVDVALCPPFPWLLAVRQATQASTVLVGAQNCHTAASGAFTGEVSPTMLAPHVDFILAGHSERRHVFGESDELVGQKVGAILSAGSRAVLCVGETLAERQADQAATVVTRQLSSGLASAGVNDLDRVVVAYEPVWAIGTGVAATPEDAQQMCAVVRDWLGDRYGETGRNVGILYGGSVTPDNAGSLFAQPDVDGGLVGGASLKADSFQAIVDAAAALRSDNG
jgi:triosephosphate isomerase